MADRVEIYLKGSSNYDASVRLLGDTDTGTIGLPNLRLQILVSGAWQDVELDTPAATGGAATGLLAANNLSDVASAATSLANLGGATAASVTSEASSRSSADATLTTAAAAAQTTANAAAVKANNGSDFASAATTRTNLGLAIGTNVQAWAAKLDAQAALTWAADTIAYFTSASVTATTALTAYGRLVVGQAITPAADQLAYWSSSSVQALTGITALARTILALTTATLWRVAINKGAVALTDAATIATDCSLGNFFTVTLAGNRTLGAPTNLAAGASYVWAVSQDGTGSRTLAYNAVFDFGVAGAPALTTTASKTDYITGYSPDGTKLHVVATKGFS